MRWGVSWIALTLLVPVALGDSLRTTRTEIEWTGVLPKKSRLDEAEVPGVAKNRPLLVYIESDLKSREQERFDNDQIDSAQTSIDVKTRRWNDATSKGEKAKAKALRKDIDKDIAARAKYLKETDKLWKKLWTLKRKVKK